MQRQAPRRKKLPRRLRLHPRHLWSIHAARTTILLLAVWSLGSFSLAMILVRESSQASGGRSVSTEIAVAAGIACSDGTGDGQCVVARTGSGIDRPLRCDNGLLVEDSATCGCPSGYFVWGSGVCTLHPQARFYTHDLRYDDPAFGDVAFKASHFDEVFSHTAFKSQYRQLNPKIVVAMYRNFSAMTDTEIATAAPAFCATQNPPCDPEDMYIHYRDDAGTRCDAFDNCALARGWNYSCSPNCTPAATATTRGESRTFDWWLNRWSSANYNDPGWQAYNNAANLARAQEGGTTSDVLLPDVASYYPGGTAFDKTVEYYGIPLDGNHPRIQETFDVEASMGAYLSSALGRPVPTIPNAMALSWYYHPYFHTGYQSLNTPIEIEVWLDYTNLNTPMGGVPRALTYEIDYLPSKNVLAESLQGRKFYLQGANDSTSYNTKAQIFLLASYYLLNNKNLAFAYRDATRYNRDGNFFPSDPAQNYVWFQGMAYDVGVPVVNSFGLRDVFGAAGTTEHAEFATGNDPSTPSALSGGVVKQYHLFARQYSKALVLAKFLTYGGSLGPSSATTHQLGGTYRRLLADGTLDAAVITSITLENNEAAILVPVDVTAPAAVTDLQAQ